MLYKKEDYPNFLDEIPVTYDSLLESIKSFMPYVAPPRVERGMSTEVDAVENWACHVTHQSPVPMVKFVDAFHDFIKERSRIPSETEFKEYYFKYAMNSIVGFLKLKCQMGANKARLISAISDRCDRTYPSLVRDLEFALLLRDKYGIDILYNKKLDTDMAIDMMYTGQSGINYGIHLFTKTKRADAYRKDKDSRHKETFTNVINIDHKMDMSSPEVNGLKLYGDGDVKMLIARMNAEKQKLIA